MLSCCFNSCDSASTKSTQHHVAPKVKNVGWHCLTLFLLKKKKKQHGFPKFAQSTNPYQSIKTQSKLAQQKSINFVLSLLHQDTLDLSWSFRLPPPQRSWSNRPWWGPRWRPTPRPSRRCVNASHFGPGKPRSVSWRCWQTKLSFKPRFVKCPVFVWDCFKVDLIIFNLNVMLEQEHSWQFYWFSFVFYTYNYTEITWSILQPRSLNRHSLDVISHRIWHTQGVVWSTSGLAVASTSTSWGTLLKVKFVPSSAPATKMPGSVKIDGTYRCPSWLWLGDGGENGPRDVWKNVEQKRGQKPATCCQIYRNDFKVFQNNIRYYMILRKIRMSLVSDC